MKYENIIKNILYGLSITVALFLGGCQVQQTTEAKAKPNIIWITCEDISPFVRCFGEENIKTPNIDQLANDGVKYTRAFTTAGVCAPSRSAIITGMHPASIGTQHMRTKAVDPKYRGEGVPNYSAVIPAEVKCFPEYLRMEGYYTTNNQKEDYQFDPPVTVWDDSNPTATFRNNTDGKPFFSVFNLFVTHESQLWFQKGPLTVNPDSVKVPPYYPDTETVRHDIARLYSNIEIMDAQVGEIIAQLKKDGLYEQSYIFFYSDHGGSLPWMKREVLDRGIHIPLVVKFPNQEYAGTENNELVSAVDFAPTVLSLADIKIPGYMRGQAFLGDQKSETQRKYIYAGRDRMDSKYDRVRAVRDKHFEYIYNYMPEQPAYQDLAYRLQIPMMKEILQLKEEGKLNQYTMNWFKTPKATEELYDIDKDPDELHNLAGNPAYKEKLEELRTAFRQWEAKVGDMSTVPEKEMVETWWNGHDEAPVTAVPEIELTTEGAKITCSTPGASIGYRIIKPEEADEKPKRVVQSWDYGTLFGLAKNGDTIEVAPSWKVYDGTPIRLNPGERLRVNAMRIGYQPSEKEFINNK